MLPITLRIFLLATILISSVFASDPQMSYQQQILTEHNKYRTRHHAPELTWDRTMSDYALRHASKCVFRHSATPYGENLAAGYSSISSAVSAWYDEGEKYSYNNPGFSYSTGHFTQLIWKSSKKIGCAYVSCNGRNGTPGKYLACEYSPAGNIINPGRFARNVLPE